MTRRCEAVDGGHLCPRPAEAWFGSRVRDHVAHPDSRMRLCRQHILDRMRDLLMDNLDRDGLVTEIEWVHR